LIYFIEYDSAGNIFHALADPSATIVPLVNRVLFSTKGVPNKDANGNDLSPSGLPLEAPLGVDVTTFNSLIADGIDNYTCDPTTHAITKKVVANATATA
jgi:hypothetical protein